MLPKSHRLSRLLFLYTKIHGEVLRFPHFNLVVLNNHLQFNRVSVVTSAKFHKCAVIRNRFRRLLYHYFQSQSGSFDLILFPRPSMLKLSYEEISTLLAQVLSQLSSSG